MNKSLEYYLGLNYRKTVYQDEDGQYIVEIQELPGCVADGSTPNEAFENLREAMKSWLASRLPAGLSVPEPRQEEGYSGRILLRMPKFLHAQLAQQAEWEGASLNQHVVTLLADASARLAGNRTQVSAPGVGWLGGNGIDQTSLQRLRGVAATSVGLVVGTGASIPGFGQIGADSVVELAPGRESGISVRDSFKPYRVARQLNEA